MSEHTATPWHFDEFSERNDGRGMGYIRSHADNLEIAHHGDMARGIGENRANGERIVACVNACEGMQSPAVQIGALRQYETDASRQIATLTQQRDELARELGHLARLLEPQEADGSLSVPGLATLNGARAALAKVKP